MTDTHTTRTVRGLKWVYASTVVTAGLQIVLGAVLARLLTPASFGLVAMAGFALRFGQYFAQMGLGSAVVQKPVLHDDEIRASFWASLLLGLAFFAGFWVLAPFIAQAFRDPEVVPVLRVLALGFPLTGAATTATALMRREMRFRGISVIEIVSYFIGTGLVGVTLAWRGFGVWALVAATIVQSVIALIGYYAATRHDLRMTFSRAAYEPLLAFGSRVSGIGFLEFLGSNLDTLAVGRFLGPTSLGLYNRALSIANLPVYYLSTGLSRVLLPSLSRVAGDEKRLRKVFGAGVMVLGTLAFALGWAVALDANDVVLVLLGPKWLAVIPLLMITGIAAPLTAVTHIAEVLLEARGALTAKLTIRAVQVVLFGTALLYAARFGLIGYAIVFSLSELSLHVAYGAVASRNIGLGFGELMWAYVPAIVIGVLTASLVFLASVLSRQAGWPLAARAVLEMAVGAIVLGSLLLRGFRGRVWWTLSGWLHRPGEEGSRVVATLDRLALAGGEQ